MAIALFAVTGLAAANPMASFVDCSDSFWQITCGANVEPELVDLPGEPVEIELQIDNDTTCVAVNADLIVCHT